MYPPCLSVATHDSPWPPFELQNYMGEEELLTTSIPTLYLITDLSFHMPQ